MSQPAASPTLASVPVDVAQPARSAERKASICVPRHVAIVPSTGLKAADVQGWVNALSDAVDVCLTDGVAALSLLAWDGRESTDISARLKALTVWVRENGARLSLRGVRLNGLGACNEQTRELLTALQDAPQPAGQQSLCVTIAANYSGRAELADAVKALASESKSGRGEPAGLTVEQLKNYLSSRAIPPVDLLIRAGGRTQLSDFLLWQTAYAELLFLSSDWSEMRSQHFRQALGDYALRRRTFGGLESRSGS
jgi:undecaprenyl diphosphate synthase